jgi:hypothetical protein
MQQIIDNCLKACQRTVIACNQCASACLGEEDINGMQYCIQLDMECAAVCMATIQLLSLNSKRAKEICHLCAELCMACAAECSTHDMEHCTKCSEACADCAEQCRILASAGISATV